MSRCSPAPGKKDSTTPTAEPIDRGNFHGIAWSALEYTKHFVGVLCYLIRLHWLPQSRDYVGLSQPIPPDRTDRPPPPTKLFKDAFPYSGFPVPCEICSYECRSLSRKGMSSRCVLLTHRFLIRGCIEVRLPQFKATPPPPEFSFLRAGIATVANESVIV